MLKREEEIKFLLKEKQYESATISHMTESEVTIAYKKEKENESKDLARGILSNSSR